MKKNSTSKSQSKTEIALKESEQRYRTTLMSVGDGMIATDTEGRVEMMNPVAEELTGWKEEEARGKPLEEIFRLINEDTRKTVENPVRHVMREGMVVGLANHSLLIAKDGTEHPIADSAAPIRNEKEEITGVVLVFRDQTRERAAHFLLMDEITERRRMEESLTTERRFLRQVIDTVPAFICVKTEAGPYALANESLAKAYGTTVNGVEGKSDLDFSPTPEEAAAFRKDDLEVIHSRRTKTIAEEPITYEDGTVHWYSTTKIPVIDPDDSCSKVLVVAIDITDIREHRENLQELVERRTSEMKASQAALVEAQAVAHMGSWEYDAIGDGIKGSEEFYRLFDVAPKNITRLSQFAERLHPDDRERVQRDVDDALQQDKPYDTDYRVKLGDESWRNINARGRVFTDTAGKAVSMVGTCLDITERKRAEEVIKDNEKRFRDLIESLPQLFWTCKVDGPCDYLSKQWVDYTGIPESEQLGYRWLEQLHPEDKDRTVADWMEKVKTGKSFDIEFRIRRNDGVYRWFKTRAVPMRDAEGNIIRWFGSNTDFDEIKKTKEHLRKLNRTYSLLSDINQAIVRIREPKELFEKVCNIAVGQGGFGMAWIGLIDGSSQKLQVIAQAGRTNGYHQQVNISLTGEPLSYCPIDSALRQGKHNICKIIENEEMAPCQKIAFKLGFCSSASLPLKVSDILRGALTFYSDEPDFFDAEELKLLDELAMDISFAMEYAEKEDGRKQSEEALRESREKYYYLYENSPVGMYHTKIDGSGIIEINNSACEMLGFKKEELIGQPSALRWADPNRRSEILKIMSEYGVATNFDADVLKKDGTILSCLLSMKIFKEEGYIEGFILDITDRKRARDEIQKLNAELEDRVVMRTAQLEASNKELEAFSYSVSHDLRAPLRHVSGYVELLNNRFQSDLPEKGQHYLNSIGDSVRIMGMLIDDLLQFSKTGRMEMHQSDLDMNEIVKEVKESLCKDNPDRKIEWALGKLPSVNGDEAMLRLVWMNLLSNAVKFTRTRKKARIGIGARKDNKELVFFVRDNGVGFDMQYAQKLFGVFQRLHPTEEFEGTGIGLANVHRIVLRHGGRTWAEAEPDKGAVFYFSIPNK